MLLLPWLKSPQQPENSQGALPLTLCFPVDGEWLFTTNRKLIYPVISSALRGVIKNTLSAEYGNVLGYWIEINKPTHQLRDRLMVEVDDAFELAVDVFKGYADALRVYRNTPSLTIEVIGIDPMDAYVIVRISNG